jgi:hypothetical protein
MILEVTVVVVVVLKCGGGGGGTLQWKISKTFYLVLVL